VTRHTFSYLWSVPLSYGFLAALMVEASAFQAIGRSWPGFWIFLLRVAGISIPLAYVLTRVFGLPILAVWMAVIAGNVISATVGYFWIRRALSRIDLREVPVHAPVPA
jgi:Na+-driven multidrug efflux pump